MKTPDVLRMTASEIATALDIPVESWALQCHGISLAIVRAGLVPGGRVARGSCRGVGGQHSWIVDGRDCYARDAKIIDPTLWSYVPGVPTIWHGSPQVFDHTPHGAGSIFQWGMPVRGDGPIIELEVEDMFARRFLDILGPLDSKGWGMLLSQAPVEGWPAKEIYEAAAQDRRVAALIPIDKLGMVTELNPQELYF